MSPVTPVPSPLSRRVRLAGRAAVMVSALSRRTGRGGGSVIGGRVGLFLAHDLLEAMAADRPVALVSGTNGKTTTTHLLAAALGGPPRVATSSAGANLPPGLAVALASSRPGSPAVLEVDEGYLGAVAAAVAPRVVALLNLSRDQLDRVGEVRMVANRWRRALADLETTVVANADDPLVVWAAGRAPKVIWVTAGLLWQGDAVGCPACEGRIVFASGTGSDAGWSCACGFARPHPDARLVGDELATADGRRLLLDLNLPSRANRANAAMAAVAAGVLGVDEADALRAMATVTDVEGRFARVTEAGVTARLLLAKNPAGWAELLDLLEGGTEPVVIGINARIADGHDPSWLWDVAFERLSGRLVVATGDRRGDLAVRLRYAGIEHTTVENQLDALAASGSSSIEYVGNYTAFQDLRRQLGGHGIGTARSGPAVGSPRKPTPVLGALEVPVPQSSSIRSTRESALRVVVIYPDLLGTYGDSGNGRILACRAAWRGLAVELILARSDQPLPGGGDIYCIGGGEDGPQVQAAERLADGTLSSAVAAGATVLAVCAGYQIMGTTFPGPDGRPNAGVSLLEIETVKSSGPRAVGELVGEPIDGGPGPSPAALVDRLTGFENHAGLTRLGGSVKPLACVVTGVGNGAGAGPDGSRTEGAWSGRVIGTYMHGPVLARNPSLADLLLTLATGTTLAPLDDGEERALHDERLHAPVGGHRTSLSPRTELSWRRLIGGRKS